jgi:hypothetical protein
MSASRAAAGAQPAGVVALAQDHPADQARAPQPSASGVLVGRGVTLPRPVLDHTRVLF